MAYFKWEPNIEKKLEREIQKKFRNLKIEIPVETTGPNEPTQQSAEPIPETKFDRYVRWAKDHPLVSVILVVAIVLGAVLGIVQGLISVFSSSP